MITGVLECRGLIGDFITFLERLLQALPEQPVAEHLRCVGVPQTAPLDGFLHQALGIDALHGVVHPGTQQSAHFVAGERVDQHPQVVLTHAGSRGVVNQHPVIGMRLAGAYAWHSLAEHGAHLALGSDFPVEAVNPMLGIYAAVTRQDLEGWPEGGWLPEERMTRKEALLGFTIDAARAGFMEDAVGTLEPGKYADFIVLDRDIMSVPPQDIPGTVVLQTRVGGKKVYER